MRQTLYLGLLAGSNIGLAFLSQWYVITQLGAGVETDALFAGMTLPQLILTVVSGSLAHVLVPLLAGESHEQSHHDAWAMFALIGGLFTGMAFLLFVSAHWWTPWTVPGFSAAGQALTIEMTRIQLIGMVFAAVNGVQIAAYHARQKFLRPEIALVGSSLLGLVGIIWLLPRYGIAGVAWMTSFRMALQTLILLPGMGRPIRPDLHAPAIALAWGRIKPLLLGTTYYKTDPLIDRLLLSAAGSGTLSLYYLAQQIYAAATQVLNKAIASPLVPKLSKFHKAGSRVAFRQAYHRELLLISLLCLAGIAVLALVGQPLLNVLIGYRKIKETDVNALWNIMLWLAGAFIGGNAGQISASAFYSIGDTTTPTRLSVLSYTAYIPCKIAAFYAQGVMGLAVVTSVYYLVNVSLQIILFKRATSDELSTYGHS